MANAYILVVDDEDAVRYALRCELESLGYEVAEAANGVEAIRSVQKRRPDLMVLDIMMSPLSGWEVLDLVRENDATRTMPVLLLTALGEASDEARGWQLQCDWYQVKAKPVAFEELGLVVERLLSMDTTRGAGAKS